MKNSINTKSLNIKALTALEEKMLEGGIVEGGCYTIPKKVPILPIPNHKDFITVG